MTRLSAALVLLLAMFAWSAPAQASADITCGPSWALDYRENSGCDGMAIIGPRNDTRINLLLLLFDRRGAAPRPAKPLDVPIGPFFSWWEFEASYYAVPEDGGSYSSGEGSRCRSNESGGAAFAEAIGSARGVAPAEREELAKVRAALQPNCGGMGDVTAAVAAAAHAKSPAAKEFARYLLGACAFYAGSYDEAASAFASLGKAANPWVKESARYMLGRVEVNRAQAGAFDEYGFPAHFDAIPAQTIADAETNLRSYLRDYPEGRYAASAKGLLRRVYWLGGNTSKLAGEYGALLASKAGDDAAFADEIDDKLLRDASPAQLTDPMLLAVADLRRMRGSETHVTREALDAQRRHFAGNEALHDYLLAAHAYYVAGDYREALRLIPDAARQERFSYLQFSRQMLRGMALEALHDRNARGFWLDVIQGATRDFQRPAVELALAWHDERAGQLARVFEPGSPVHEPSIREILLMYTAGPALLRQQARTGPAHERQVALFVLLYKGLTRGAYRDFLNDLAMVPADAPREESIYDLRADTNVPLGVFRQAPDTGGYPCPALSDSAAKLAANPNDYKARLCVADFLRTTGFDEHPLDSALPKDELGGTPSLFAGGSYSRLEVYKSIIADAKAPGSEKAYALYRAVMCYGPSGNNSCGGVEVDVAQRKAWFQRLKHDYPASAWAQDLRYYW